MTIDEIYESIGRIKPGFKPRKGQKEASLLIEKCIAEKRHALLEAPTGFGKSIALMVPAIKEALSQKKRVVISTETITLQQQYVDIDLPLLKQAIPGDWTYAVAKGRGQFACKARWHENKTLGRLTQLQQWADKQVVGHDSGDLSSAPAFCNNNMWQEVGAEEDCERRGCAYYGDGMFGTTDCFVYHAAGRQREADVIVTNHTLLLLDLQLGGGVLLGEYDVVIIDEAHSFPEKAQQTWGSELRPRTISKGIALINKILARCNLGDVLPQGHVAEIQEAEARMFDVFADRLDESRPLDALPKHKAAAQVAAEDILAQLKVLHQRVKAIDVPGSTPEGEARVKAMERLSKLHGNIVRVFDGCAPGDSEATPWLSYLDVQTTAQRVKYPVLHAKPIEVGAIIYGALLSRISTVIMCSATLRVNDSFFFFRREMGCPKDAADEFVGESPFNFKTQVQAYAPLHLPDPKSDEYEYALAKELVHVIESGRGRALILFTNARLMARIATSVRASVKYVCFTQGDAPKQRLIEMFKEDIHSCLFATRSFFTGVDIPGEALSTVVLIRAPFRVPSEPLFKARCDLINSRGGSDFKDLSLPLMLLDVRQAFGRLIRTEKDTGLFALLDSRALKAGYGQNIKKSLPVDMEYVTSL